jgi:hypothetical protein
LQISSIFGQIFFRRIVFFSITLPLVFDFKHFAGDRYLPLPSALWRNPALR